METPNVEIMKEAWQAWEDDQKTNPAAVNPHAYTHGYITAKRASKKEIEELREEVKRWKAETESVRNVEKPLLQKIIDQDKRITELEKRLFLQLNRPD